MTMASQFVDMTLSSIFLSCFASLVKFGFRSKFHLNIITDSWVKTIYFYQRLTKNSENVNTLVGVWLNIWRLGGVRDTNFGKDVSNKMLLNAANARVTVFTVLKLAKGGEGGKLPSPPRLGLNFNRSLNKYHYNLLN